jgi:hypothetical protein
VEKYPNVDEGSRMENPRKLEGHMISFEVDVLMIALHQY